MAYLLQEHYQHESKEISRRIVEITQKVDMQ